MATSITQSYDDLLRMVLTWPKVPRGVRLEWTRAYHMVRNHDAWCCTH